MTDALMASNSPSKVPHHPHVKGKDGQAFIDWLISAEGQKGINDYRIEGRRAFCANAK